MEVWKIIFLSKLVIWRFHVNLLGCKGRQFCWKFGGQFFREILKEIKILRGRKILKGMDLYFIGAMSTHARTRSLLCQFP